MIDSGQNKAVKVSAFTWNALKDLQEEARRAGRGTVKIQEVVDQAVASWLDKSTAQPAKPKGELTVDESSMLDALLDAMRDADPAHAALRSAALAGIGIWRDHVHRKKTARRGDQRKRA